jgi:hypothetical protein
MPIRKARQAVIMMMNRCFLVAKKNCQKKEIPSLPEQSLQDWPL